MASLADVIDRLFQRFVLRDVLGLMLPGALLGAAVLVGFYRSEAVAFFCISGAVGFQCVSEVTQRFDVLQALLLGGLAYAAGWSIQCAHLALVDVYHWAEKRCRLLTYLWRLSGVHGYVQAIDSNSLEAAAALSLVTLGALAPDKALKRLTASHAKPSLQEAQAYTERASALMMFSANLAIVGVVWIGVLIGTTSIGCWALLGLPIVLSLYHEYWRLLFARNLRMDYFIDAANAVRPEPPTSETGRSNSATPTSAPDAAS